MNQLDGKREYEMNETVIVALIVAVLAPMLNEARKDRRDGKLAVAVEKQRQLERAEEKRDRAEVLEQAKAASQLIVDNNLLTRETRIAVEGVHKLVNSDKTGAMRDSLDQFVIQLAMMREIAALRGAAGERSNGASAVAMATVQSRIDSLASEIAERDRLQAIADKQALNQPQKENPTL